LSFVIIIKINCRRVSVQLDIKTYEKITETLENYALFKFIEENKNDKKLSLKDAREYYNTIKKDS